MAENTSYYVVLDANILIKDYWLEGKSFSYLKTHQFLEHRPIVPEVAYLETKNNLKNRAESLLSNSKEHEARSSGNVLRLMKVFNYQEYSPDLDWSIDSLLERWDKNLKEIISDSTGQILPNPDLEINEIIERSITRKKPFSKGDRGFRDTIIWLSTLDLIRPTTRVSFVTTNTNDFFEPGSSKPHPDILSEAEEKLCSNWKMLFHPSLEDFIAHFDSDRASSSEALNRALISNGLSNFNLWDWLENNLIGIIGDDDFDAIHWAGVPYHAEAPRLEDIEEIIAIDIPRTHHTLDDVYRLYCDVSFIGHFICDIGYAKAEVIVNPNQILWKDESDSFWTTLGVRIAATFLIRIDFDMKSRTVIHAIAKPLTHWVDYDEEIKDLEENYSDEEDATSDEA